MNQQEVLEKLCEGFGIEEKVQVELREAKESLRKAEDKLLQAQEENTKYRLADPEQLATAEADIEQSKAVETSIMSTFPNTTELAAEPAAEPVAINEEIEQEGTNLINYENPMTEQDQLTKNMTNYDQQYNFLETQFVQHCSAYNIHSLQNDLMNKMAQKNYACQAPRFKSLVRPQSSHLLFFMSLANLAYNPFV